MGLVAGVPRVLVLTEHVARKTAAPGWKSSRGARGC